MANVTMVARNMVNDRLLMLFQGGTPEEAAVEIDDLMTSAGYALEEGRMGLRVKYGRGSKTGRVLFGGLTDRQEFAVNTETDGTLVCVEVAGTATVLTAGALGISKMRKELQRLSELFKSHFGNAPPPAQLPPGAMGAFALRMTPRHTTRAGQYVMVVAIVLGIAVAVAIMTIMSLSR